MNCYGNTALIDAHLTPFYIVSFLGHIGQVIPGNSRAIRMVEKRFTALLSRIGFPDMCFAFGVM